MLKIATYAGGALGMTLLIALMLHSDLPMMLHVIGLAGWGLIWLIPYRGIFFLLYAIGWLYLLGPYDPCRRAGLGYLFWVTTVRDAFDRLLPVASVGGGFIGIRLLIRRGLAAAPVSASVITEVLLTLTALYLFTAMGWMLLIHLGGGMVKYHGLVLVFLLSLPVPAVMALLLRFGSVFERMQHFLRAIVGPTSMPAGGASLDRALHAMLRRHSTLLLAGTLQLAALISGTFEVWLALRLFHHPVGGAVAFILESLTQALRHLAFMIPAGLGVQEAGLMIFGHALGIGGELALAVSMAKRMREVICGLPALLSWQWLEARWLRGRGDPRRLLDDTNR